MSFRRGDVVLYRGIHATDSGVDSPVVADVKPAIVAEDAPGRIALWVLAGTPTKASRPIDPQQPKPWFAGEWRLEDSVWSRWNALFLIEPKAWHATWVWWTPEWEFLGWYVNLQEPLIRTATGFDHRDLQLDIVVDPGRRWRLKDEDDLERSVAAGVIASERALRVRAEAAAVIARVESTAHPFVDGVAEIRPDPAWPIPSLGLEESYLTP